MAQCRTIRLATLDDVSAEVERLHRSGYEQAGKWNVSQTCEHHLNFLVPKEVS